MVGTFQQLMLTASIFILCAFALGVVFDRVGKPAWRQIGAAVLVGALVTGLDVLPFQVDRFVLGVDAPLLLVAALYVGPTGAMVMVSGPMLAAAFGESPNLVQDLASLAAPALVGLTLLAVWSARGLAVDRRTIVAAALASPLGLFPTAIEGGTFQPAAVQPLLLWTMAGTLLFGLMVDYEHRRARISRARRKQRQFHALTRTVSAAAFEQQLDQQWSLHERYGYDYSYLTIRIDEVAGRDELGPDEWERIRAVVATAITGATRDSDVCTPIGEDTFGLLLPHAALPFSLPVAERVQRAVERAARKALLDRMPTVSIGCAEVEGTTRRSDIREDAQEQLRIATSDGGRGTIAADRPPRTGI